MAGRKSDFTSRGLMTFTTQAQREEERLQSEISPRRAD